MSNSLDAQIELSFPLKSLSVDDTSEIELATFDYSWSTLRNRNLEERNSIEIRRKTIAMFLQSMKTSVPNTSKNSHLNLDNQVTLYDWSYWFGWNNYASYNQHMNSDWTPDSMETSSSFLIKLIFRHSNNIIIVLLPRIAFQRIRVAWHGWNGARQLNDSLNSFEQILSQKVLESIQLRRTTKVPAPMKNRKKIIIFIKIELWSRETLFQVPKKKVENFFVCKLCRAKAARN